MPRPGVLAKIKEDAKRRGKVLTIGKMGFVPDSYNSTDPDIDDKIKAGVYQKNKYSDTKLPSSAFASENFHEMDEEDARLDKYSTYARGGKSRDGRNKKDTNQVLQKDPGRGRRILEIYDDSPNGHNLTLGMPSDFEDQVQFLSKKLKTFNLDFPEEFGILHYKLGKLFYAEFMACKDNEKVLNQAKCALSFEDIQEMTKTKITHLENAIFHFSKSREVFLEDSHPLMFSIISMLLAQGLRYRIHIMMNNNISQARGVVNQLTGKGTSSLDCARRGLSVLSDVHAVYNTLITSSQDKLPTTLGGQDEREVTPLPITLQYKFECAICNLEMGWFYYLQHEILSEVGEERDDQLSELAIISLERALDYSQSVSLLDPKLNKNFRDPQRFPDYLKLLNNRKTFDRIEGLIYYVFGRVYQDMAYNVRNVKNSSGFLTTSYDNYSMAVKQQYLGAFVETVEWGDCHHRLAAMVLRDPYLVNPDLMANVSTKNIDPSQMDMLHFDSAISHLKLCLRCLILGKSRFMDIHFHIANCLVAKLNKLIDQGSISQNSSNHTSSITKALSEGGDAFDVMSEADFHLHECLMRITPASTQSTLDAYIYYFSCLKLAEIRMLEAATRKDVTINKRDKLFLEAIGFVVDALQSRTLADNFDLHYVAAKQLVQMIAAAKKSYTASRGYAKVLIVFSCIINRLSFLESKENVNYDLTCEILTAELSKQLSIILQISDKMTRWKKKHIGPLLLTDSVTRGYAMWSFEQDISTNEDSNGSDRDRGLEGRENQAKAPEHMPPPTLKKVIHKNSLGMNITMSSLGKKGDKAGDDGDNDGGGGDGAPIYDRPAGVVPLAAMGHIPDQRSIMDSLNIHIDSLLKYSNSNDVGLADIDISQSKLGKDSFATRRSVWRDDVYLVSHEKDLVRSTLDAIAAIAEVKPLNFGQKVMERRKQKSEEAEDDEEDGNNETEEEEEEEESDDSVVYATSSDDEKMADKNVLKNKKAAMKNQPTSSIYFNNTKQASGDKDAKKKSEELAVKVTVKQKQGTKIQNENLKSLKSSIHGTPKKEVKNEEQGFFSKLFSGVTGKSDKTFDSSLHLLDRKKRDEQRTLKLKLMKEAGRANLYASLSAFYNATVVSRCHRLALQARGASLRLFLGERMRYLFEQFRPEIQKKYKNFIREIKTSSREENGDLPPFLNLRELSQRPFVDLKSIFVSHSRTFRLLSEFETFLRTEVMSEDQFLPLVHASQTITRESTLFDQMFMDQNKLILTMSAEDDFRLKGDKIEADIRRDRDDSGGGNNGGRPPPQEPPAQITMERTFDLKGVNGTGSSPLKLTKTVINERSNYAINKAKAKKDHVLDPILAKSLLQHNLQADKMKMPYDMCHILDGTAMDGGIRELMQRHLMTNEAMLSFNLSAVNSNLEVLIIWKEELDSKDKTHRKMTGVPEIDSIPKPPHIIMELVKNDVDTSTLNYLLSGWLEAIATRPNAKRLPRCTDVLHSLSCAMAMTEIVKRLPTFIDTLHICFNTGPLALVPWNLLLIEAINPIISADTSKVNQTYKNPDGNPVTVLSADEVLNGLGQANSQLTGQKSGKLLLSVTFEHLIERFTVLLGPTLALFELNNNYNEKLKHVSGLHRMVAIDGDSPFSNQSDKKGSAGGGGREKTPLSKKTSFKGKPEEAREGLGNAATGEFAGGVRATQLEVGGCASVWSADPSDHRVLMGSHACLANLKSKSARDKKKKKVVSHTDRQKKLEKELHEENERATQKTRSMVNADEDFKIGLDARDVNDISTDDDSDSDEELAKDEDRKSLFTCRVLHIASFKHDLDNQNETGIRLPINESEGELSAKKKKNQTKDFALKFTSSFKAKEGDEFSNRKTFMNARDVVSQLYLPNCALCVLSRFSLCDDIVDPTLVDSSMGFIESFFLAGATTVVYPLWSGVALGHGSLAHQLILLHFYSNLPSFAHDKRSIAQAMRKSMFWLRSSTADDIIAFINRLPAAKSVKTRLIEEMESYVAASLSPTKQSIDKSKLDLEGKNDASSDSKGNRVGGNRMFFTHFINWAFFVVSGQGGNIHHPDLVVGEGLLSEQHDAKMTKRLNLLKSKAAILPDDNHNVHKSLVDLEPDNPEFEYEILVSEGKLEEARMFKEALKAQKWKRINDKMGHVMNAARVASQKVIDGLDVLDKTFLDQDSDEIEISDDDKKKKPDPNSPVADEDRGFSGFLKTKKVHKQLPKIEPIDRVKYHFGYGDQSPGTRLTPQAPGLESPLKRNEALGKKNAIAQNKLNDNDPATWDQYSSPRAEKQKMDFDKKVKFGKNVELNGSSSSIWVKVGEELRPKEQNYSDEDEDAEDSDVEELSDDGLKERLSKVGKTTFKKIHKNITSIKKEVRSYEEAQKVATNMLKNLPNSSILPDFSRKKSSKIFDASSANKTHSSDKVAEMATSKKDDCTIS